MTETETPSSGLLASAPLPPEDVAFLAHALKGVTAAHVRLYEADSLFEAAFLAFIGAQGIPVVVSDIARIEPPPHRRYSLRYAGPEVVITLSQHRPLRG